MTGHLESMIHGTLIGKEIGAVPAAGAFGDQETGSQCYVPTCTISCQSPPSRGDGLLPASAISCEGRAGGGEARPHSGRWENGFYAEGQHSCSSKQYETIS